MLQSKSSAGVQGCVVHKVPLGVPVPEKVVPQAFITVALDIHVLPCENPENPNKIVGIIVSSNFFMFMFFGFK